MQRATRHGSAASRRGSDHATGDNLAARGGGIGFSALESPGDAAPPGIQFSRGSFSDHLQSLDSPSSIRGATAPAPPPASTQSLLRSPTRKRPPVPTPVPRPPVRSTSKGTASTTILMPTRPNELLSKAVKRPVSPSSKTKNESLASARRPVSPAPIELSVNPVDALAKKLRQQAAELTTVYEQMERKDEDLERLRGDVKQLSLQLEMRRDKQRHAVSQSVTSSKLASGTTSKAKPTVAASSSHRLNTPVTAKGVSKAGNAIPPNDRPYQAVDAGAAMARLESSLIDLRQCHRQLMEQLQSSPGAKTNVGASEVQREQTLYIRVLEEAVHLKASELHITGHEELLVVLAELRHTIYQQEQDIGALQEAVNTTKSEILRCKTAKLEDDDALQREISRWEQECAAGKLRETTLQRQVEDVQRLAHTEHMRFRQERATHEVHAQRVVSLEDDLRSRTQELRQWETTRSESWVKKESTMAMEIEELKSKLEAERAQAHRLRADLDTATRQVEELKALQDGLLQSIDTFVAKEDANERQIKALEAERESNQSIRGENEVLRDNAEQLQRELDQRQRELAEHTLLVEKMRETEALNMRILAAATPTSSDATGEAAPLETRLRAIQELLKSSPSPPPTPWLVGLLEETSISLSCSEQSLSGCRDECDRLQQSQLIVEESLAATQSALLELQALHLQTKTELIQTRLEAEKRELELSAVREEALEAHAHVHLRETLAKQIFEQENLLKTLQERLHASLEQNSELMEQETHVTVQLQGREDEIRQLEHKLREYRDQETVLRELECELEGAASLAEQQNAWNQQLTVELEHLELEKAEQDQLVETLEIRDEAVSSRFATLFSQYIQFVAANKQRLMSECTVETHPIKVKASLPSIYDEALGSGDVLQMLLVFPTLVEEYLAAVMLGIQGDDDCRSRATGKKTGRAKGSQRVVRMANPSENADTLNKRPPPPEKANNQLLDADWFRIRAGREEEEKEEALSTHQLREIAHAFGRFKT